MAGAPAGTMMAPPLAGSPRVQGHRDYVVKVLLHGLTGPLTDKTYTQVMVPMGPERRLDCGDRVVRPQRLRQHRRARVGCGRRACAARLTASRKTIWTAPEIETALPVVPPQPTWRMSASHNTERANNLLTTIGWSTAGAPQQAGTWFQIELPAAINLVEVDFNTPPAAGGGRGRGGAPADPPVTPRPRLYQVQVSTDGQNWRQPVATGEIAATTAAAFPAVSARFVRVTQTDSGTATGPLQVTNVRLFAAPAAR